MSEQQKGYISTEKTVWCGTCQRWDQTTAGGHVRAWIRDGWRRTKEHGWRCPDCLKKATKP